MNSPVLALVDTEARTFRLADITRPQLRADDLSATRGDGIFEAVWVKDGTIHALEEHLARLVRSAKALALPEPDLDLWREVIHTVIAEHPPVDELIVRLVISRGVNFTGPPTAWCLAKPMPEFLIGQRSAGVHAILLDRGYDSTAAQRAPWLLIGSKNISYAVNMAAGRYAMDQGADEAIFVSSDGLVLEAPTATVLLSTGKRLVTPDPVLGILHGTTQLLLFEQAARHGWQTEYARVTPDELFAADGVWIVSSGRGAAPVRSIDQKPVDVDDETTAFLNGLLLEGGTPVRARPA